MGRQKRCRERDWREIKQLKQLKKDDISDTHKSTDQSRPTIVVVSKVVSTKYWYIYFSLTLNEGKWVKLGTRVPLGNCFQSLGILIE